MLATTDTAFTSTTGLGGTVPPAPPSPTMDPSAYTSYTGGTIIEQPLYPPPSQPPTYQPPVPQGNGMGQKPCGTCRGGGAATPAAAPVSTAAVPVKPTTAAVPVLTKPQTWQWWVLLLVGAAGALIARKMLD